MRGVFLVLTVSLVACAGTAATTPRIRVARDFGRAIEKTSFDARWQLTGCGRTVVYLCTTPVRDCWREGQPVPAAP